MGLTHLNKTLGNFRKQKSLALKVMEHHGDEWSDPQWDAYHFSMEMLDDQISYYEEQLHNLG